MADGLDEPETGAAARDGFHAGRTDVQLLELEVGPRNCPAWGFAQRPGAGSGRAALARESFVSEFIVNRKRELHSRSKGATYRPHQSHTNLADPAAYYPTATAEAPRNPYRCLS